MAVVAMLDDARMSEMDDYINGLPPAQKAALARVRTVVEDVAPEAEEDVSYGMPAFLYAGRPLLGFRAAKRHLSISLQPRGDRGDQGSSRRLRPFQGDDPFFTGQSGAQRRFGGPRSGAEARDHHRAVRAHAIAMSPPISQRPPRLRYE
jgi:hypothetical protein